MDAGDGEDRGDRGERIGWADHDRVSARDRREHLRAGLRLLGAAELQALDQALGALADHELLERTPADGRSDPGADGVVAHRQHARVYADRLVQARECRRRPEAVLVAHPRALHAPREVAVAEVEPHLTSQLAKRVHHRERVVAQAPAALVDLIGQPEGDEVRVGRDVGAVDLDVIARIRDHHETRGILDDVEHAPRELRAAGAAGEDDHVTAVLGYVHGHHSQGTSGRPARRIPAWAL